MAHAQAAHGVGRCAILDFDVHQGNGNAAMCWDDPTRLYASTHERGIFPCGVSAYAERPNPSVLNRPLSAGAGSAEFRRAWTELLEAVDRFEPDAIFLSAGFDAHADRQVQQPAAFVERGLEAIEMRRRVHAEQLFARRVRAVGNRE